MWLPSVVPGLNLACRAFAGPGEAVMTVTPVYPPFLDAPPDQGRRLVTVPAASSAGRWQLPLEAMEAAVTADTRVLLFCHPHNPLGRVWRQDEVAAVVDFCRRHDLVLCSDEIHCDLILDELAHVPAALAAPGDADRIVTLMSPSKTFNLPGLNFAFAIVADEELRRRFQRPGEGLLPFPGCFAIDAAEAAYREGGGWLTELLEYLRGNRDLVERFVAESLPRVTMGHVEATYLAWLDVRELDHADAARGLPGGRRGAVARGRLRRPGLPAPQLRLPAKHPAGGAAPPAGRPRLSYTPEPCPTAPTAACAATAPACTTGDACSPSSPSSSWSWRSPAWPSP